MLCDRAKGQHREESQRRKDVHHKTRITAKERYRYAVCQQTH